MKGFNITLPRLLLQFLIVASCFISLGFTSSAWAVGYTLTASASPTAGGTVAPYGGSYLSGAKVTITATPKTGYKFSSWSGCSSTTTVCTVTMTSNKSVVASFVALPPVPQAPTLNNPANGATNVSQSNVSFSWSVANAAAAQVNNYRIVISQDQSFSGFNDTGTDSSSCSNNTCLTTTTGTTTSFTKNMDLAGKTYYWKVRANGLGGVSPWSQPRSFTTAGATNNFVFPFSTGQTWKVCQGYNTQEITHKGTLVNSFDFSIASNAAVGAYGCNPVTASSSSGQNVIAPANGRIAWKGKTSTDIICIDLDKVASNGAKSVMLGHLTLRSGVSVGSSVSQGDIVGTLNSPVTLNGNYSHIHMGSYSSSSCYGTSIPFGTVFGGSYNFPSNGSVHQWYGSSVSK